ncbi:hypothetical protein COV20_03435 [Candidatus Woesearchaeota archaeon CG10_big_fil_rev_8_21_14_0_10_45_16]|nr:MAG: hypothetical protein COV20_03435 [Candidatus Woesearchaeota archaeon CG10_big_fil_rev_8_21_14_0_10_45_16]
MAERKLALMVFYNSDGKILLQDRFNMRKWGEDWGYFGGAIDEGETPKQAVVREIREELEFNIKKPEFLGRYETTGIPLKKHLGEIKVIQEVFIAMISEGDYESMILHEGAGMEWFSIEQAKTLNMYPLDPKILEDVEKRIKK